MASPRRDIASKIRHLLEHEQPGDASCDACLALRFRVSLDEHDTPRSRSQRHRTSFGSVGSALRVAVPSTLRYSDSGGCGGEKYPISTL
jgi:hypothetical protein